MRKIYLLTFLLLCGLISLQAQIFSDNFDSYSAGDPLAEQAGEPWTTWSNSPGGPEDPNVSDEVSFSVPNSVGVVAGNDNVLLLGDSISGRYKISFQIYIPTGKIGYYNILQLFAGSNSEWGTQVFFDTGGYGHIDAAAESAATFNYEYDEWILMENYVDLDNDWAEVFVNSEYLVGWQWTLGTFGTEGPLQLGAVNFYAWDETGTPGFFFDDVMHEDMPLGAAPTNLTAEVNEQTVTLNWDAPAEETPDSYYVLRNGELAGIVTSTTFEETLELPGTYSYEVKAYYTGSGLSQPAGPVDAEIAGGTERANVLLEIATGTWCTFCPGSAMGADDLIENGHAVAVIEYHNGDEYATSQSDARNAYYGVTGYPTSTFDGIDGFSGGSNNQSLYETYLTYYEPRIATQSVFDLEVDITQTGKGYGFSVDVSAEQLWDYEATDLRLHVVLTESHIPENWFGLDEVNFVCREMYPDQLGTAVTLENTGDSQNFNFPIEVPDTYMIDNCELVIFMQDNGSKEVMNSQKVHLGQLVDIAEQGEQYSRIYPNPATDNVTIETVSNMKHLSIFSLNGQKVYDIALDQNAIDLNIDFLKSGIYIIQLETENGTKTEKLNIK